MNMYILPVLPQFYYVASSVPSKLEADFYPTNTCHLNSKIMKNNEPCRKDVVLYKNDWPSFARQCLGRGTVLRRIYSEYITKFISRVLHTAGTYYR